ncbi:hypothetical protein LSM04_007532 [Trypanosoma melophagium]|uniref:uncharacterized protein n=1 Tax=Trypanosoma melophagium TaxID=715481 RepID=UPI00351A0E8C|nr:hypothetical protein LSM04_007532 [Trypanosoma melophagium]
MRTTRSSRKGGGTPLRSAQSSPRTQSGGVYTRQSKTTSTITNPRSCPSSLETPRSSHNTTSNKTSLNNRNNNYHNRQVQNELAGLMYQKDETHDSVKKSVATILDFYNYTMPVWAKRVSGLDIRMWRLPVGDESFLERALNKLSVYLNELNDTLHVLSNSARAPETTMRWKRYVQNSHESLLEIKNAVCALQSRIAKILSFATSTSSERLNRVLSFMGTNTTTATTTTNITTASPAILTTTTTTRRRTPKTTRLLHPRKSTEVRGTAGLRSHPSSAMGFSSAGPSSAGRRSKGSLEELGAGRAESNHATPVRSRRRCRQSLPGSDGNSSRGEFPQNGRYQEDHHHNHNHHNNNTNHHNRNNHNHHSSERPQPQERCVPSLLERCYSWADILTRHSMRCPRAVSSPLQSLQLRKEPVHDSGGYSIRLTEFVSKEPIYDFSDSGTHYNRRSSGLWDVSLMDSEYQHNRLSHSKSRDRTKRELHPDERRMLLERIDFLEKSFVTGNTASLKEAEHLFDKLYGSRRGPRYFSEWIDDIEMRAVRQR